MRLSFAFRPALALALALAGGTLASQPAAAFDPAVQAVGWNGYGYGHGYGHGYRHHHGPPRHVYVPPPRYVYVPPPVVYHRPPCWRLPPWHPASCAPPPPRFYRHW